MLCLASSRQLRTLNRKPKTHWAWTTGKPILTHHSFVFSKLFHGAKGYIRCWRDDSKQGIFCPLRLHSPGDQGDKEVGNYKSLRVECYEQAHGILGTLSWIPNQSLEVNKTTANHVLTQIRTLPLKVDRENIPDKKPPCKGQQAKQTQKEGTQHGWSQGGRQSRLKLKWPVSQESFTYPGPSGILQV